MKDNSADKENGASQASSRPLSNLRMGLSRTACAFRIMVLAIVFIIVMGGIYSINQMSETAVKTSSEQLQAQRAQIIQMKREMIKMQKRIGTLAKQKAISNYILSVKSTDLQRPNFTAPPLKPLMLGARHIPSFISIRKMHATDDNTDADTSSCLCTGIHSSTCFNTAAHEAFCAEMDNAMHAPSTDDSETLSPYFSAPRDVVELSDELFLGSTANVRAEAIRPLEIDVVITYVNGSVPEWQSKARAVYERWLAAKTRRTIPPRLTKAVTRRRILEYGQEDHDANLDEDLRELKQEDFRELREILGSASDHEIIDDKSLTVRSDDDGDSEAKEESTSEDAKKASSKNQKTSPRRAQKARLKAKPKRHPKLKFDVSRFRDWNELLYALRSIFFHGMCQPLGGRRSDNDTDSREAFVDLEDGDSGCPRGTEPWILHNVYIVVPSRSHIPFWLDAEHPRIRIVTDRELKQGEPDQPTFNSNVVESLLHRIPGLSRFFLYFNNDMLLGRRVSLFDYFRPVAPSRVKGIKLPRDPASYMLMEPILYVEGRGMCSLRVNKKIFRLSCVQLRGWWSGAVLTRMVNYNRHIVYERFGLIPSHARPAHLPFLIDRTILEEMMDVALKDIVPRDHAFREDTDLWMAYLYPYYALLKREQFHAATVSSHTRLVAPPRDASVGNGKLSEELIYVPRSPAGAESHSDEHFNWVGDKTTESFFSLFRRKMFFFGTITSAHHARRARKVIAANHPVFVTLNDDFPLVSAAADAMPLFRRGTLAKSKPKTRPKRHVLHSLEKIEEKLMDEETILLASCGRPCKGNRTALRQLRVVQRSWELLAMQQAMREATLDSGPAPWEI